MRICERFVAVSLATLMVSFMLSTPSYGATAGDSFRAGKKQLAAGDFKTALKSFSAAVRADQGNAEYLQQYALLRQVLAMRKGLDKETNPRRWETMARGLHAFYVSQGLYDDAIVVDQKLHERLDSAMSALILAETQLAMNRASDAAEVLARLPEDKHTAGSRAIQGIALVRQGQRDDAREIAASINLPKDAGPGTVYAVARLNAAAGNADAACQLLGRCLEATPPTRQAGFREHAKVCPEFASLIDSSSFASALATKSKIAESACSGGSSCATCPMRGQCSEDH